MTPQDYIDFIKLCAESHPDILHHDEANKRFSQFGESVVSDIAGGGILKIKEFCVLIYTNEFDAPSSDQGAQTYKDYSFNFEICKYCGPKDYPAQLLAQNQAEIIAQDFINEIKSYIYEGDFPFTDGTRIFKRIEENPTSGGKANLYGWRVEIPIRTPKPGFESHVRFTI
jgi:hypothetical protein